MDELRELIRKEGKIIRVYLGKEVENDPFEHTVTVTMYNPVPIKGLVTDLIASQIQWKLTRIRTEEGKELVVDKRHKDLLERSQKIEIDGQEYIGWRDNWGKLQLRQEGNYVRILIYTEANTGE